MSEELRVDRTVERPFVALRGGESGLERLGRALGQGARATQQLASIAEREARREAEEIQEALASPLITEEEIAEIEGDATFPLGRIKAQNRRGELMVESQFDQIQQQVEAAPDAIAARQILRKIQQQILDGLEGQDTAIAAGVRNRMATIAPRILAEGSERRIKMRKRQERLDVNETNRLALETSGPEWAAATIIDGWTDELVAQGDSEQYASDTSEMLLNHYLQGDNDDPLNNIHADDVLETIDLLLAKDTGIPRDLEKERGTLIELRQKIENDEQNRFSKIEASGKLSASQAYANSYKRLVAHRETKPGEPIPEALIADAWNNAPSRTEVDELEGWLKENAPEQGALYTTTWQENFSKLRQIFAADFESGGLQFAGASALIDADAIYSDIGRRVPASTSPEDLRTIARESAIEAVNQAREIAQTRERTRAARVEDREDTITQIAEAEAEGLDPVAIQEIKEQYAARRRRTIGLDVEQAAIEVLQDLGLTPLDFENPVPPE